LITSPCYPSTPLTLPSPIDFGSKKAQLRPFLIFPAFSYARPAMPYQHDVLLQNLQNPHEAIAIFEYADHVLFMPTCNAGMLSPQTVQLCAEPVWDKLRAHDLINHLATAFLLAELQGDTDAAAALAPDAVSFPGITYQTTGF
jgi:hypothetical protein